MNPLTIERSSSPTTIHAHVGPTVGAGLVPARAGRPQGSPLRTPPRFVVTLDSSLTPGETLARIPIAITGKWVRDGNDFSITLADLEEIVRNFTKRRNGEINVDYDHASEMPEVAAGGPVPSAGRIVKLDPPEGIGQPSFVLSHSSFVHRPSSADKGAGPRAGDQGPRTNDQGQMTKDNGPRTTDNSHFILYGWYEPTSRARKLIESREYRYISPAINWAGRDKRTGKIAGTTLTSVALTNRPFLEELPQIRLSDPAYQLVEDGIRDSGLGVREEKTSVVRGPSSVAPHNNDRAKDNGQRTTDVLLPQSQITRPA